MMGQTEIFGLIYKRAEQGAKSDKAVHHDVSGRFIYGTKTFPVLREGFWKVWYTVLDGMFLSHWVSLVPQTVKNLLAIQEMRVRSLGQEDPLEKEMAAHSNIPAQRIPGTEELGGLQSMELKRVRHNWATNTHFRSLKSK